MKGFGQFCPLALASEVVGERWTPLVLRELMFGATRFNDIHRGVPRMSPSLLARRLKRLETAGVVMRRPGGRGRSEYALTEAGNELRPIIEGLAGWGMARLPATLSRDHADPDLIMWDLHRRIDLASMPAARTVVRFMFSDQPKPKRFRWIVGDAAGVTFCITDPGFEIDLFVSTDSWTMARVWYGDLKLTRAIAEAAIVLDGPRQLCEAFPSWLKLSPFAAVWPGHPRRAA